jgi:hypothetical protein
MKAGTRIKFFFGIIMVILLVGALSVFLTASMSVVESSKATLDARTRSIGTDYSGMVIKQNVEEGDTVENGEVLFVIESSQLKEALGSGRISRASLPFTLTKDDSIELRANGNGKIDEISFREGSFVPTGAVVATFYAANSLFVTAHFQLSPPDYARINKTNRVELLFPDNTRKEATITSVSLESSENADTVDTVIEAQLNDADMDDFRFSAGTPVVVTLHLAQEKWYQNLVTFIQGLFTPGDR